MDLEKLKYPIGKFKMPTEMTTAIRKKYLNDLSSLAGKLEAETSTLSNEQLDTPYRPEGWTIRQVVHHYADSHINAFCRVKMVLTEESPTIKPYHEGLWADMEEAQTLPVNVSIEIIRGIHIRLVKVLSELKDHELLKFYVHPEYGRKFTLDNVIALYGWHCNHHLAHITGLKHRMDWA